MDVPAFNVGRPAALLDGFASLGCGPELGLLRSFLGLPAPDLLEWAIVGDDVEDLARAVRDGFGRLGDDLAITDAPSGPVSRDGAYDISFRDACRVPAGDAAADPIGPERRRLRTLAEALVGSFRSAGTILVHKSDQRSAAERGRRLREAVDRHGPAPVLVVVEAAAPERAGSVDWIAPGLLRGEVDRFWGSHQEFGRRSAEIWLRVAERARALVGASTPNPFGSGGLLVHRLRSHHGTVLVRRASDGEVRHGPADGGDPPLLLVTLPDWPDLGFLASSGASPEPLLLHPGGDVAPVLAVRIERHGERIALRHPTSFRYAAATPVEADGSGGILADRPAAAGWELFEPVAALPGAPLAAVVADALAPVVPIFRARFASGAWLGWAATAPAGDLALLGAALVSLAPPDTLTALAARIRADEALAARCLPLVGPELDAVLAFRPGERPPERVEVGPEADRYAGTVQLVERESSARIALLAASRRLVEPTRGVAIVATARNEGPYLLDWIAHHRALGAEHVFLYSNDNDDGSDELLGALARAGIITWLPNRTGPGIDRQSKAYNHAFQALPALLDFRWTAIIDPDEFLVLDPSSGSSLDRHLVRLEADGAEEVVANWRMFTSGRQTVYADQPLTGRLRQRFARVSPEAKTIVRTNRAIGSNAHVPIWASRTGRRTVDGAGRPYRLPQDFTVPEPWPKPPPSPLWINHYHLKSLPEYVWKMSRNRGVGPCRAELRFVPGFLDLFLTGFDDETIVDDAGALAFAADSAAERERLLLLDGVAAAHAAVIECFTGHVCRMVRELDAAPLAFGASDERARFAALLADSVRRGIVVG